MRMVSFVPATLVLGGEGSGRGRYAVSLLRDQAAATVAVPSPEEASPDRDPSAGWPDSWTVTGTNDLSRTILRARHPVLVDDLTAWVALLLDRADAWSDPERALAAVTDAADELVTVCLGVPFDVVLLSTDVGSIPLPRNETRRKLQRTVAEANRLIGAALPHVVLVTGGRALDLSDSPRVR
ncbi:bifunctional adenosylcobinamide kinase/adenosylcobinamide-phosphate guanylyltransferase [Flexivirga meconopsidis]|uniref:bifunctional adenosylcobinamide kinase/adenosylcobinamide-phosphate guanylyltransferase n=1 Tax=Flexivirga meconopsidis TaxID=2977121 RepID=UPI002240770D|nr:bifunctional adenosylcobinamide kinase/adenosylcobinamide-phosphate guanylyltransferase [Flexivirga meconopsidis]